MKNNIVSKSKNAGLIALFVMVISSCEKENIQKPAASIANVNTEAAAQQNAMVLAATMNAMDITAAGLQSQKVAAGRVAFSGVYPRALDCNPGLNLVVSFDNTSHRDTILYTGTLTVDYGTQGVVCDQSVRKGKITDHFLLVIPFPGKDTLSYFLSQTLTFEGFQSDSVSIDGTLASTSVEGGYHVTSDGLRFSYRDGTFISLSGELTALRQKNDQDVYLTDGSKQVTGDIKGTLRDGSNFNATISKSLIFSYSCSQTVPVSGEIDLLLAGSDCSVDFGIGTCDQTYTITVGSQISQSSM